MSANEKNDKKVPESFVIIKGCDFLIVNPKLDLLMFNSLSCLYPHSQKFDFRAFVIVRATVEQFLEVYEEYLELRGVVMRIHIFFIVEDLLWSRR